MTFRRAALITGVLVYAIGWFAALVLSVGRLYATTWQIGLVCFMAVWVLASVYWGLLQLPERIADLKSCFKNEHYDQWARKMNDWFANNWGTVVCAIPIFALCASLAYSGMFGSVPKLQLTDTSVPRFALDRPGTTPGALAPKIAKPVPAPPPQHLLPKAWYESPAIGKFFLLLGVAMPGMLAGAAGAWLFFVNIWFLVGLSKFHVAPRPTILVSKFRLMTDFYLYSTGAWFVGVASVVVVFFSNFSRDAQAIVGVTSFIGLTAFMGPQWLFHRLLVRSQHELVEMAIKESPPTKNSGAHQIAEFNDRTDPQDMWVLDFSDMLLVAAQGLLAPLVLFLKTVVLRSN